MRDIQLLISFLVAIVPKPLSSLLDSPFLMCIRYFLSHSSRFAFIKKGEKLVRQCLYRARSLAKQHLWDRHSSQFVIRRKRISTVYVFIVFDPYPLGIRTTSMIPKRLEWCFAHTNQDLRVRIWIAWIALSVERFQT